MIISVEMKNYQLPPKRLKTDDLDKIKKTSEELSQTIQKVGQELYSAAKPDEKKEAPAPETDNKDASGTAKSESDNKTEPPKDSDK